MKAFVINGKLDGELAELPDQPLKADEVRVKVAYVGICGSDLHYYFNGANGAFVVEEPLIPGHELSGVIAEDPSGELPVGTRVTLHPATFGESERGLEAKPHLWPHGAYLGSASTHPHTQGAMSEFFIAKRSMIRILPESLSLEMAALAEPLGVAFHAVNIADGVMGKDVLVSGAGPIGLCVVAAAKIMGAASITSTDILPAALLQARVVGASHTIQIGQDEVADNSYDIVFECSAAPIALSSALQSVRRAGVVVQVGMFAAGPQSIAIAPLVAKEISLRGTFRFNDEITDAVKAFEVAKDGTNSGKVLVKIN